MTMTWRSGRVTAAMDELIERSARGQATVQELETLAGWRHDSIDHEQHYRRTIRLFAEVRSSVAMSAPVPSVETILNRPRTAREPKRRRRIFVAPVIVAAAVGVVLAISYVLMRVSPIDAEHAASAQASGVGYATGASELATVQLSDGTVVRLAPNTKLRFIATRDVREAMLEGRAFFSVGENPGRPFRVRTRLGTATAHGSRFELATGAKELTVVVAAGRVELGGGANTVAVLGGQRTTVRDGNAHAPESIPEPEAMEEWVGKFLVFQETPVREAARQLAEVYGVRVVVADSAIATRTVSGTFADRDATQVLDAICLAVKVNCESRLGELVIGSR
jgi:transmembrane sensor